MGFCRVYNGIEWLFTDKKFGSFFVVGQVHVKIGTCQRKRLSVNVQFPIKQRFHHIFQLFEFNHVDQSVINPVCLQKFETVISENGIGKNEFGILHYIQIKAVEWSTHQFVYQCVEFAVVGAFSRFVQCSHIVHIVAVRLLVHFHQSFR